MIETASTQSPSAASPANYRDVADQVTAAMRSLARPGNGNIAVAEGLAVALGLEGVSLNELRSAPLGAQGQQLLALRYLAHNGDVWSRYFNWQKPLSKLKIEAVAEAESLFVQIAEQRSKLPSVDAFRQRCADIDVMQLVQDLEQPTSDAGLAWILGVARDDAARQVLRARFKSEGPALVEKEPRVVDVLGLISCDLSRFPATTVGAGDLKFIIVADKGEMGTRAVREAIALGFTPVVLFSKADDDGALQVRVAEEAGGFSIPLLGSFRETYANPVQIAEKVLAAYAERFGEQAEAQLARSALYPGYGPLAENTAAIEVFRRNGIIFCGPMQDVVERAGDKRKFRLLAESIDTNAVTPGIVMDESDPAKIISAIEKGAAEKRFVFPGRLKAANGGGGRGQVVIQSLDGVPAAVTKVLAEIRTNGWDQGVMFEQNIFETTHLEVQVVRDRFGNTRHFGMRDCTEQRASQKIQEEAPPAILAQRPELAARMCEIAVEIADKVDYVGACTVELMYKDGHFYLLEMNTRIQVEHPVTEEAHRIRRGDELLPLNLVQLQMRVAQGRAIPFAQADVVQTHVAREFRINAESFKADIKDPRDGKMGLFLPNAGVFDVMEVPSLEEVHVALREKGITGVRDLSVRFDCGFEVGDDLVNKDPTFGKLIVAVAPEDSHKHQAFELLRQVSIVVLQAMKIEGRQLMPNGKVLEDRALETNLVDHVAVLETEMLKAHSAGGAKGRHVNWLIEELRSRTA